MAPFRKIEKKRRRTKRLEETKKWGSAINLIRKKKGNKKNLKSIPVSHLNP